MIEGGTRDVTQAARGVELEHEAAVARPCILSGEIRTAGRLCDVISFLAHASWWGELIVEQGDTLRALYFDEGHVVGAQSTVDAEQLPSAPAVRDELVGLAKKQIEAIFSAIVSIDEGRFFFFEGFDDRDLAFRHRLSVDALLLDAIRKMDEKKYFESRIPSKDHVPVRTSRAPATLDPFGVFDAIDGKRTVEEVAQSVGIAEMEVTRALFQHVQAGDVAIKPPRLGAKQMVEIYNDAIVVLLRELDAMGEGDGVRAQLATFGTVGGERPYEDAKPEADGTIDADETVARIQAATDVRAAEERLEQWLYDYASFALFLGRPHLERKEREKISDVSEIPRAPRVPRIGHPVLADVPSLVAPDGANGAAATSTARLRRVPAVGMPGLDASRTLRMKRLDASALIGAKGTQRMHVRVVLPDEKLALPVAVAPVAPVAPARPAAPLASGPNVVLVSSLVAVAFFVLGLVVATAGLGR